MKLVQWKAIVESLLFTVGDEGITLKQMSAILGIGEDVLYDILQELKVEYDSTERGITLMEVANSYQLTTKKVYAPYIKKLVESPNENSLSQAALETLAIIAYKQPITRLEIEDIRGVKTDRPLQSLIAKALIKEVGRAEGQGRAILYGTSKEFLDYFGLKTIDELPPLSEHVEEYIQEEADLFFEKFTQKFDEEA